MIKMVRLASLFSVLASIAIMSLKFYTYSKTGSTAVLSDALESIVNVLAALFAFFVIRFSTEPADKEHPYGHGKMEYFSATFEGGLIAFAGVLIGFEAIRALWLKLPLHSLEEGIFLTGIAGISNLLLGLGLLWAAKKSNSSALHASSQHILSDVWSTVAAMMGLVLVKQFNWWWADPLVAIIIGVLLARTGYRIVKKSTGALLDSADPDVLAKLAKAFDSQRIQGVIDIHLTKMIRSGNFHHVDCHLVIPRFWTISESHEMIELFERKVIDHYPFNGEINFHLDPCRRDYCQQCSLSNCQVREAAFVSNQPFTSESLVRTPNPSPLEPYE